MTDQAYTDADLRAEAVRQIEGRAEDPDFVGVGEAMQDESIDSTGSTWGALDREAFGQAQRDIHDLIGDAPALGLWAVQMTAAALQPHDDTITINADGSPYFRLHLAFAPAIDEAYRRRLVKSIGELVLREI